MPLRHRSTSLVTLGSLLVLVAEGACSSKPAAPPPVSPDAWAVVDGREIKRDEVEKAYRRMVDLTATPSDEEAMTAKLNLLNEIITQNLLMAKSRRRSTNARRTWRRTSFRSSSHNAD
jgi:hypothetical protein